MKYFKWLVVLIGAMNFAGCGDDKPEPQDPITYPIAIRAADISLLPEIRTSGVVFKDLNGLSNDALNILQQAGCNTIRLRLWHTPATSHSGLEEVAAFAAEVKSKGLNVWLTIHYSDTWADPGHQTKPAAWSSTPLSIANLADSVYNYTKKIVTLIAPDYVQVGNEINDGFLWPDGRLSVSTSNFITLLKKGVQGVRDASDETQVMIHFAGLEGTTFFYDQLKNNDVDYDIIALSYYPRWHTKSLITVKSTLAQLVASYNKQIILAETAYPFTLGWNDWTNNLVGLSEHLVVGYPATPKGQHDFMMELRKIVSETNGGLGLAYWAPEWVAYKGTEATNGSPWENMAVFNFDFKAMEAIKVFNE